MAVNLSDSYVELLEDSLQDSKILRHEVEKRDIATRTMLAELTNRVDKLCGVESKEKPKGNQKARRSAQVIVPRLCRTKCRNMYKTLLKNKRITGFDLTQGKDSSTNEKIMLDVLEEVRVNNGADKCVWTTDQMKESLSTYYRTLKDNFKRNPNLDHTAQCRRLGRVREKLDRRTLALENDEHWPDAIKARIGEVMNKEYTSSDESGEEEDENGLSKKVFFTKTLRWESSQLKDIKHTLDECYRKNVRGVQVERKRHPDFSSRSKPLNAVKWAIRSTISTSTPKSSKKQT